MHGLCIQCGVRVGALQVCDLGLARNKHGAFLQTVRQGGTLSYVAPEVHRGGDIDEGFVTPTRNPLSARARTQTLQSSMHVQSCVPRRIPRRTHWRRRRVCECGTASLSVLCGACDARGREQVRHVCYCGSAVGAGHAGGALCGQTSAVNPGYCWMGGGAALHDILYSCCYAPGCAPKCLALLVRLVRRSLPAAFAAVS